MKKRGFIPIFFFLLCVACTNPFAPKLSDSQFFSEILGDQRSIDGIFKNLRYSYTFKDTLIYGQLLAPDFTFIYRNYEQSKDVSWGRDEEMMVSYNLFQGAQNLDLVWNEVIIAEGDSLTQDVSRGFNLTVTFNPGDIIRIDGRVNLRLVRTREGEMWMIQRWRDESNF